MNKKITLEEFFEMEEAYIHCDIEEKAIKLLKAFDIMGKTWCNGNSYLKETHWDRYCENTCFSNYGYYDAIDFCKSSEYIIFEFEDIILETENENLLFDWNSLLKQN